jgi:hypothetical protein
MRSVRSVPLLLIHLACPAPRPGPTVEFAHVLVLIQYIFFFSGIVADEADRPIFFHPDDGRQFRRTLSISSISSVFDDAEDPFNFSVYMDKVRRSAVKLPLRLFFWGSSESRARPGVRHVGSADYQGQFAFGTRAAVFRQAWGTIRCRYGRKRLL